MFCAGHVYFINDNLFGLLDQNGCHHCQPKFPLTFCLLAHLLLQKLPLCEDKRCGERFAKCVIVDINRKISKTSRVKSTAEASL